MEGCIQIAPLKLVRLRRMANLQDSWLSEQADPLRRLIRKHNLRNNGARIVGNERRAQ